MIREIYLAGGCYWGTQKFLDSIQGVAKNRSRLCKRIRSFAKL